MFGRKVKDSIVPVPDKCTITLDDYTYPIVGKHSNARFVVIDTLNYPWRFKIVDTKHNLITTKEHLYLSLAEGDTKDMNKFDEDGCSFPWDPR